MKRRTKSKSGRASRQPVRADALAVPRAHDWRAIDARWKQLARRAKWRRHLVCHLDGYPVAAICTPAFAAARHRRVYISTGIHGDEPAPVLALLAWAEASPASLDRLPLLLLPCLNPRGLLHNSRTDSCGRDLNRIWHDRAHPLVRGLLPLIGGSLDLVLTLHEDYDADGMYLYELLRRGMPGWGERLIERIGRVFPADSRKSIEGRRTVVPGLVRRVKAPLELANRLPEALFLHQNFSRRTFTFETPSEEALADRIGAHMEFIQTALGLHQTSQSR